MTLTGDVSPGPVPPPPGPTPGDDAAARALTRRRIGAALGELLAAWRALTALEVAAVDAAVSAAPGAADDSGGAIPGGADDPDGARATTWLITAGLPGDWGTRGAARARLLARVDAASRATRASDARLTAAARELLSPQTEHPKRWVIDRFAPAVERTLLADPLVAAWVAGTHPIPDVLAAHLERLTGTPAADWRAAEGRHLAGGGLVLPARVIHHVLAVEQAEDDVELAVTDDPALARAVAAAFDASGVGGTWRRATVRRALCWGVP